MNLPEGTALFSGIGRMVVLVGDLDAALAFYRDVLEFEVLHDDTADGYRYLQIAVPLRETVKLWSECSTGCIGRL